MVDHHCHHGHWSCAPWTANRDGFFRIPGSTRCMENLFNQPKESEKSTGQKDLYPIYSIISHLFFKSMWKSPEKSLPKKKTDPEDFRVTSAQSPPAQRVDYLKSSETPRAWAAVSLCDYLSRRLPRHGSRRETMASGYRWLNGGWISWKTINYVQLLGINGVLMLDSNTAVDGSHNGGQICPVPNGRGFCTKKRVLLVRLWI